MAVGSVNEALFLASLPEGFTFTVTALETDTHDNWRGFFDRRSDSVPYDVAAGQEIAEARMTTSRVLDSGVGPTCKLRFKIAGTIGGKTVEKKGNFTFTTSDWPLVGRPDQLILNSSLDGMDSVAVIQDVRLMTTPDPFSCAFVLKGEELGLIISREKNLTNEVVSTVVGGILTVHGKAISWVFGKII
ncbi:hypothetical protein FXN63_23085 [Pigmentiphaga aceris]|uniref:Uncharacterized protein n=1 Tax=Pigmentiphaga aceris TaxID=1940612 RepID=A0A5C0B6V9_9BURK|nr:hypothetical protein [Pigmentiphaga aceris]QEI08397.1 hypothetical protein FXN63_23085 [Pigmentiphaga aceris]